MCCVNIYQHWALGRLHTVLYQTRNQIRYSSLHLCARELDAAQQTEILHPSPSFPSLASSFKLWQKNHCVSQLVPALKCCSLTHRPMGIVTKESSFLFSSVSQPFAPQLLLIIMSKKISKDLEKPSWRCLHTSILLLALGFRQYFSRVAKHGIFIQRQFTGIEKAQQTMHSYSIMHEHPVCT